MAVEFKMISKWYNSALARFSLHYGCLKNSPQHFIRQFRNCYCNGSFPPETKCLTTYPSSCPDPSKSVFVCAKKVTRQYSSDVVKCSKCCKCLSIFKLPENYVTQTPSYSNDSLFRQFDSKCFDSPCLLEANKNALEYVKGLPKSFFFRRNDGKKPKKRIPRLILIQNPFTWLMIKLDFSVLRHIWDSEFTEKEFKFGTKQAISRVTNVISQGQFTELNGLLTKAARISLMRELERNWSEKQRSLLALKNEDIQISSPRKVYFIRIADKKYCDVDMAFLALKWEPINSIEALIFTEIFARFHREYTPHCIPEWTIAYFKVTRFEVLRKKPKLP